MTVTMRVCCCMFPEKGEGCEEGRGGAWGEEGTVGVFGGVVLPLLVRALNGNLDACTTQVTRHMPHITRHTHSASSSAK